MSAENHKINNFSSLMELIDNLQNEDKNKAIFIMFCGSVNEKGISWCSDCVAAEPVIDKFISTAKFKKDFNFIHVEIERTLWKDQTNPFRTHAKLKLKVVPTLLKWNGPQILEENECGQEDLLLMLFDDVL